MYTWPRCTFVAVSDRLNAKTRFKAECFLLEEPCVYHLPWIALVLAEILPGFKASDVPKAFIVLLKSLEAYFAFLHLYERCLFLGKTEGRGSFYS